jgi:Tol biopolymer transport system component
MVKKFRLRLSIMVTLSLILIFSAACTPTYTPTTGTQLISLATDGSLANNRSKEPCISADGRYIAFASDATNLVEGDKNGVTDVFVHDLAKGTTTRVSVSNNGTEGNGASYWPFISADGRYVTFTSDATNLVEIDTNDVGDVYVHDNKTGTTELISIAINGKAGDDLSFWSSISADGRYVVFMSNATNLVSSDTNNTWDIFMRDRSKNATKLVSLAYDGTQANNQSEYPVISANGRFVAYASDATNLVPGDNNGFRDVFEFDRASGKTIRVSVATDGTQTNTGNHAFTLSISANGKFVAFSSLATTLIPADKNQGWDIYVHDRDTGETTLVSVSSDGLQGNADSFGESISADGRFIVFESEASNLVPGDANGVKDIFVHDRQTGKTELISVTSDNNPANGTSGFSVLAAGMVDFAYGPLISSDGKTVVFMSDASNLVPADTNGNQDIFVNTR